MKMLTWCAAWFFCAVFMITGAALGGGYDWGQEGVADTDRVTNIEQITDNPFRDNRGHYPPNPAFYTDAWRNDSQWVVYMCDYNGESSSPDINAEICVVKPGDSDAAALSSQLRDNALADRNVLTSNALEDTNAGFTPDWTEIVFQRWVQEDCVQPGGDLDPSGYDFDRREIWKMDFVESGEATNQQSLAQVHLGDPCEVTLSARGGCTGVDCIQYEALPKISPDGSMIAFLAYEVTYAYSLWVMDADGTNPRKVSGDVSIYQSYNAIDPQHSWSPDSQWVLFTGRGDTYHNSVIYRTKPDGSAAPEALTPDSENLDSIWAFWSPDGSKIAYTKHEIIPPGLARTSPTYLSTVTLMDPDGADPQNIVSIDDYSYSFRIDGPKSWDPGSGNIIYTKDSETTLKTTQFISLWMVSRDGSEDHQLTENYDDCSPQWGPDGTMVLFGDRDNNNARDGDGFPPPLKESPNPTNDHSDDLLVLNLDIDEAFDDGDGVTSTEESGPGGDDPSYDGDENGTPDYLQNSAASLHADSGDYVTLGLDEANNASFNEDVQAVPPPGTPPGGLTFPLGFFSYSIDIDEGACTTVTIYAPKDESINSFWKYDDTNDYYEFLYDGTTGAEIFHDADQTRIVLHLCDGQRGDADNTV
ncbi:MAG: PD40 domain-containing protein, partial [Deltaproteobacteria bacterium]|nr:PD40 domain-containing protein [Deltaproteobacteria bacterium]